MADTDIERKSWEQPAEASFAQWMDTRVARLETRRYDWDALKFQADYDPKYRRAQMRYVGTGGTGVAKDVNTVPAGGFTFSTMVIPAGNIGPSHIHMDVEEIFFVLRGKMKVICETRRRDVGNGARRTRSDLGAAGRVSHGNEYRRRRRADVRDARFSEADHADVSAGFAAGQAEALSLGAKRRAFLFDALR
jgi:mannose-6-phosphate isomerase-like protein (cupin superfamily)